MNALFDWLRNWPHDGKGETARASHEVAALAKIDAAVDESREAAHRAGNAAMISINRSNYTRRALDELLRELQKSEKSRG